MIQLSVSEPKSSHGSAKDRAHHRKTHRGKYLIQYFTYSFKAPTPLPPVLLEDGVQFVVSSDT